jgi:osmotically-inducible protein OsmY
MNRKISISVSSLILATLLLAFSLGLSGCSSGEDRYGTASSSPGAKMTDDGLEDAIEAKINADMQLKEAGLSVDANAETNTATLTGTVESQALRSKAEEMAKSAHAGLTVKNEIAVKPREVTRAEWTEDNARDERTKAKDLGDTIGETLDDTWIHAKIVTKLIGNMDTPERKINVDVNNNVVTLRGTVDTAEAKTEAERVAKETEGVKRVNNQLKVGAMTASPTPKK